MWALSPNYAVHAADGGRRGRLLRAVLPRLHHAHRARRRTSVRWSRPTRARTPARNEYAHLRDPITVEDVMQLADAVGADPLPRDLPVVRRRRSRSSWRTRSSRRRGRASRRGSRPARPSPKPMWVPGRDQVSPLAGRICAKPCTTKAGIKDPVERRSRSPSSTCRSPGTSRCGSRTSASRRSTRAGRSSTAAIRSSARHLPVNPVGRRAVHQPDRRVRHAALRRGGAAGHGPRRRAPGAGRQERARPRLRRRRAVLRHVDRRQRSAEREASGSRPPTAQRRHSPSTALPVTDASGAHVRTSSRLREEGRRRRRHA